MHGPCKADRKIIKSRNGMILEAQQKSSQSQTCMKKIHKRRECTAIPSFDIRIDNCLRIVTKDWTWTSSSSHVTMEQTDEQHAHVALIICNIVK